MRVGRRLWWTNDKGRLVEDGDPNAAFLAFTPDMEVSDGEARRLGLLKIGSQPEDKRRAGVVPNKTRT